METKTVDELRDGLTEAMNKLAEGNRAASELYRAKRGQLPGYVRCFLGECFGVGLEPRGINDPHVQFVILVEDDTFWHRANFKDCGGSDTAWMVDLVGQVELARGWLKCYAEPDRGGWRFKERQMKRWKDRKPEVDALKAKVW